MPDMRDIPFKTKAVAPSEAASGPNVGGTQAFRRQGQAGKTFATAVGDILAMSNRFLLIGRVEAEYAVDIMRYNVIKYITPPAGDFHGYSMGRLAATTGRWDETLFVSSEAGEAARVDAIAWAAANVPNEMKDTPEELTVIENGAYSSVKRYRGNIWSAEMGTFTPYAGLVEDGGSMEIEDYGNPNKTIVAHWEANHMFKKGVFDSYADLEEHIQGNVKNILRGRDPV